MAEKPGDTDCLGELLKMVYDLNGGFDIDEKLKHEPIKEDKLPMAAKAKSRHNGGHSLNFAISALIRNSRMAKENGVSAEAIYNHLPNMTGGYAGHNQGKFVPLKFPNWRYAPEETKLAFCQLAMSDIELNGEYRLAPFTFVLSEELYKNCLSSNSFAPYLQNRLATSLNRSLGRIPLFWFQFEYEEKKRPTNIKKLKDLFPQVGSGTHPHIHGSILLKAGEFEKSRLAFHRINNREVAGNHDLFFSHRARLKKHIPENGRLACDLNWSFYNTKMVFKTKRLSSMGKLSSASKRLSHEAKLIYNRLSTLVDKG